MLGSSVGLCQCNWGIRTINCVSWSRIGGWDVGEAKADREASLYGICYQQRIRLVTLSHDTSFQLSDDEIHKNTSSPTPYLASFRSTKLPRRHSRTRIMREYCVPEMRGHVLHLHTTTYVRLPYLCRYLSYDSVPYLSHPCE